MKDKYISRKNLKKYFDSINDKTYKIVDKHNEQFLQTKKQEYKKYFDEIFKNIDSNIKLDTEQIEAILIDEDYEIIIAGAGSGKTTTMSAKVKYLVEKLNINPKDIIIISYTNEAVNELKKRINNDFKIPISIFTFHKFCLDIIKIKNNKINVVTDTYKIVEDYFKHFNKFYINFLKKNNFKKYLKYMFTKKIYPEDIKLCFSFLNLFKANGYKNFNSLKNDKKLKNFVLLIEDIYKYYNTYLKNNNAIDYDGMITECIKLLDRIKLNYKYLIIDEYQDISYVRFKLINKIAKLYDIKIIVVGDDFQTIYSFSGSDLSLFLKFQKLMGYTKVLKITNTYRNSQELIDIAGRFVMKNPLQIKKYLKSNKHLENPILLVSYTNDKIKKLKYCVDKIISDYKEHKNILILGRYIHDIDFIINSVFFKLKGKNKLEYCINPNIDITFLTVHTSKGLGFDNVIIVNNENSVYGFPTKVEGNKYLKVLKKSIDTFPYAEERRLFYVALTRTKNKVYLLYPKYNPSTFIKEIKKYL